MCSINLSSQPPCCASPILQMSQVHVNATLYAYTFCRDAVCKILLRREEKKTNSLCVLIYHAGQSGLGKSTLMNTLFKSKVSRSSAQPSPQERIPKTIEIKSISHGWPFFTSAKTVRVL